MAERDRWNFGPIQIYREALTYSVSYDRNGVRVRRSLGCSKLPIVLRWAAAVLEKADPTLARAIRRRGIPAVTSATGLRE